MRYAENMFFMSIKKEQKCYNKLSVNKTQLYLALYVYFCKSLLVAFGGHVSLIYDCVCQS